MSVLIKGMKMPTCCADCVLCGCYGEVYRCDITIYPVKHFETRLKNCPLVEVPPHGHLVDWNQPYSLTLSWNGEQLQGQLNSTWVFKAEGEENG